MDYEKKYKEAMERMKLCIRTGLKITPEYIFHELAESEDEKVRNGLVRLLKELLELGGVAEDEWDRNECEKYIAWLEKQEGCEYIKKDWLEHIKQSWYKEGLIDGKYSGGTSKEWTINDAATLKELIDFLENGTAKLQHDLTRYANWLKNQFTPIIERQGEQNFEMKSAEENLGIGSNTYNKIVDECIFGEQKPADKVEPKFKVGDKIYLKPEYRMPNDDTPIANTVKEIRRIDDKHYRFDGSYIFIEDQDKYELVEQKPKENKGNIGGISPNWSEEDEENFCSVYLDVKSARQNTVNSLSGELKEQEQKRMDEVISWLRSLKGRVLPKQEWNEEDEQHIDSLLKRLDALCRNKFERTRFAISEDRDWLKSLRPQNTYNPYKAVVESIAEMCKHYDKASHSGLQDFYDNVKVKCKDAKEYDSIKKE